MGILFIVINIISVFYLKSSTQIRLSHQRPLAVGTHLLVVLNSPVWMDPVSLLIWQVYNVFCSCGKSNYVFR